MLNTLNSCRLFFGVTMSEDKGGQHQIAKTPAAGTVRGFLFLTLGKAKENMRKYKLILLRLTMKNGLELKAPVTDDISRAVAFAIKWVAVGITVSPMLYGMAKLIIAVKS